MHAKNIAYCRFYLTISFRKYSAFICIIFAPVISNVICKETSMTVEVEKTSIPRRIDEDHLRLTDSAGEACKIHSNKTHIIAVVPLNSCGTEIKVTQGYLFYYPLWSSLSYWCISGFIIIIL